MVMQKSTVNGSHVTGVIVEKSRTGIGVEVDVGIDMNTVGAIVGRFWGV